MKFEFLGFQIFCVLISYVFTHLTMDYYEVNPDIITMTKLTFIGLFMGVVISMFKIK